MRPIVYSPIACSHGLTLLFLFSLFELFLCGFTIYVRIISFALAQCIGRLLFLESRLPCTVGLGAGLPRRRLSAGC